VYLFNGSKKLISTTKLLKNNVKYCVKLPFYLSFKHSNIVVGFIYTFYQHYLECS
jgi:hypothetical protein